jgi:hypothetical protein
MTSWASDVLRSIQRLDRDGGRAEIDTPRQQADPKPSLNQFVILFKPEATALHQSVDVMAIFDHFWRVATEGSIELGRTQILSGTYLRKYGIISEHYGVINNVSVRGEASLTPEYRASLKAWISTGPDSTPARILGGHQFLENFTNFSPESLAELAKQQGTEPIGPGIYVSRISVGGEHVAVLNAFHPEQLLHFTHPSATTVAVDAVSDRPWGWLRQEFIGKTDPRHAAPDSLRYWALENASSLGIEEVSANRNCFHLSAGPVEGLAELKRFFGPPLPWKFDYSKTIFGNRLLQAGIEIEMINWILTNPLTRTPAGIFNIFDLTEELDSPEATALVLNIAKSMTNESIRDS